jgi:hypothetical protein
MSNQNRRVNQFFANLIAKIRKLLIKMGSPFRISRRTVRAIQNQSRSSQAGFVLPTVTLVTVVVTLLVVTMVARSSDRARSASNARTEQVFANSAKPAVDRARAKIEALINDDRLPRTTPPEPKLDEVITIDNGKYTFADETRLQIVSNFLKVPTGTSAIPTGLIVDEIDAAANPKINTSNSTLSNREYASTAWKFPIDTDNNGKYDSIGLYSILFRTRPAFNPIAAPGNITNRKISPLESRALPLDESVLSDACAGASVANVASNEGWTNTGNKLKKSFFVYAITTPLTDIVAVSAGGTIPDTEISKYEPYSGNRSFSGLELQQDRARNVINNNAVYFEGDLELTRTPTFRINGRIYTSSSLMIGAARTTTPITLFQVSSPYSCYYTEDNSKIIVAGNVVEGDAITADNSLLAADVHLYRPKVLYVDNLTTPDAVKSISDTTQTVLNVGQDVASNEFAYSQRITALVEAAIDRGIQTISSTPTPITVSNISSPDPTSVKQDIVKRIVDEGLNGTDSFNQARRKSLEVYFSARTRKVPFIEVPSNPTDAQLFGTYNSATYRTPFPGGRFTGTLLGSTVPPNPIGVINTDSFELSPPLEWMIPLDANGGNFTSPIAAYNGALDGRGLLAGTTANSLRINASSPLVSPSTTDPIKQKDLKEVFLGDRLTVGNNLPAKWVKQVDGQKQFVGDTENGFFTTTGTPIRYNDPTNLSGTVADTNERVRLTQARTLESLGSSERGGFWELSAADDPASDTRIPPNIVPNSIPNTGGLRVITNAGIFSRQSNPAIGTGTFLPRYVTGISDNKATTTVDESGAPVVNTVTKLPSGSTLDTSLFNPPKDIALTPNDARQFVVWPDSMPMSGGEVRNPGPDGILYTTDDPAPTAEGRKGDLQMRATAIYHYKFSAFDPAVSTGAGYQRPVACVSSYYDPSSSITAFNASTAPWNPGPLGRSNNGIVYNVGITAAGLTTNANYDPVTGIFTDYLPGSENPYDGGILLGDRLAYQANLIFPNGRFANEPLRNALIKVISAPGNKNALNAQLTLPEQATLDSNLCALQIMQIGGTPITVATGAPPLINGVVVPHGSFKESAFLDGREVKSLNRNETLTEAANGPVTTPGLATPAANRADIYDLQIEQREPLEIRVTDIDMDRLRGSKATGPINTGVTTDFLLPYSGLIYASRDDALRDQSYFDLDPAGNPLPTDSSKRNFLSNSDFKLDPTRRPNGIRLINGFRLWRTDSTSVLLNLNDTTGTRPISDPNYAAFPYSQGTRGEKGLILVSNLPVYVKAQRDPSLLTSTTDTSVVRSGFNVHTREEFTSPLNLSSYSNFYTRTTLDGNFACRPNQTPKCPLGDEWRPATIFADSPIALSAAFIDGFRSDGDYDLRNNANTSTSINWQTSLNSNLEKSKDSSYVVQRRKLGYYNNSYVTTANWMPPAANTTDTDRTNLFPANNTPYTVYGGTASSERRSSYIANGITPLQRRVGYGEYAMEICRKLPLENCGTSDWIKTGAGTTALSNRTGSASVTPATAPRFINANDDRFPRRVSFLRYNDIYADGNQALVMVQSCPSGNSVWPLPLAVSNGNAATGYTYPQALGQRNTPYRTSSRNSYGDIACPPPNAATITLPDAAPVLREGRLRDNYNPLIPNNPPSAITPGNYTSLTTGAGGDLGVNERPYSQFVFRVQVNDLVNAPGNVSADINVTSGTAVAGGIPTITLTTGNNAAEPTASDVLNRVYNIDCRDASGNLIPTGTLIDNTTTRLVFTPSGVNSCNVVALVVRDVRDESNENFNVNLTAPLNAVLGANPTRTATITQNTGINVSVTNPPIIIPQCPAGGTTTVDTPIPGSFTPSDDGLLQNVTRVQTTRPNNCTPTPTPTPTPAPGGGLDMLPPPVFGLLPHTNLSFRYSGISGAALLPNLSTSLAAAYPTSSTAYTSVTAPCPGTVAIIADGNYTCSAPTATIPLVRFSGNSIFGNNRQIPPRPNDPVSTTAGFAPVLPGMSSTRPNPVARALWFRGAGNDNDRIGEGESVTYDNNKNLFVYNHTWPSIDTGSSGNLNFPNRLVLPDTVCIDTLDGSVDALCTKQGNTIFGSNTPAVDLVNLNLPFNPHYPSDANSATGASPTKPATSYSVCGVNGNSQNYQATEAIEFPVIPGNPAITSGTCDPNPRLAISAAMGTSTNSLLTPSLDPTDIGFKGQGSLVIPGLTSPAPVISGRLATYQTIPNTQFVTITATNTTEINKVHVINLTGLYGDNTPLSPTLSATTPTTLPWNAACPAAELPTTNPRKVTGVLRLVANPNQPSPVFILRSCKFQDLLISNFKLQLDGVEPNNVFWVVPRLTPTASTPTTALTIEGGPTPSSTSESTVVSGNFLGIMPTTGNVNGTQSTTLNVKNTAPSAAGINVSLRSTRFLGFRSFRESSTVASRTNPLGDTSNGIDSRTIVAAMTTTNQPIVLPVLQIHSPTANAAGGGIRMPQPPTGPSPINDSLTGDTDVNAATGQWTQRATASEINVYFVAGNTPSRSKVSYVTSIAPPNTDTANPPPTSTLPNPDTAVVTAESGGGLANFIRVLENWTNRDLRILGGFIQNANSSFGTGPYASTAPYGNATDSFNTSDMQTLFVNPADTTRANQNLSRFRKVYQSESGQKNAFSAPPNRLWGFDVGLLTQAADRFAERFASPVPEPNEFLREVDADDTWVRTLLCAAQPVNPNATNPTGSLVNAGRLAKLGTEPTNYTAYALGVRDRPAGCAPLDYD